MPENSPSLEPNAIFGNLFSRLNDLRNGTFNYLLIHRPEYYLELINQEGFKLSSSIALAYLEVSISMVEGIQRDIDSILEEVKFEEEEDPDAGSYLDIITEEQVK